MIERLIEALLFGEAWPFGEPSSSALEERPFDDRATRRRARQGLRGGKRGRPRDASL
jgi:hypothetical protein